VREWWKDLQVVVQTKLERGGGAGGSEKRTTVTSDKWLLSWEEEKEAYKVWTSEAAFVCEWWITE